MVEAICVLMLTSCLGLSEPASVELETNPPTADVQSVDRVDGATEGTESAALQVDPND